MKYTFAAFLIFIPLFSFSQSSITLNGTDINIEEEKQEAFIFTPSLQTIKADLSNAPRSSEKNQSWIKMKIPFADGVYHEVEVAEAPVVADAIYQRYPENKSYKVRGVKDKLISGRMSITSLGMSALLYTQTGNVFIEPGQGKNHKAYNYDSSSLQSISCGADHSHIKKEKTSTLRASIGSMERKFIIAVASTGEFSAKYGNDLTTINAKITEYLNLLNTIYERDLAITFELTADNDDIIFFDPATDGLDPTNVNTQLNTTQTVINSGIGSANYDIGHAFYEMPPPPGGGGWGSGIAGLGVACTSASKATGWSGCGGVYTNNTWMSIFAHEVGHQLNATHTYYGTAANCGSARSVGTGVEPGSGNSLMSYQDVCWAANGCSDQNITPQSNFFYLHGYSIEQIETFVSGSGGCFTSTSSGNSPPAITMPASMTIPKETPFYLSATVTDPDGDPLLSSWEEIDTDNLTLSCPDGAPNDAATSTTAPLFRSFDPSTGGSFRYFPQMSDILDNTQTMGEILPEVGRTIDMRCTARGIDANGISGVTYEDVTITVDGNSGPFEVTTANTPTAYLAGESVDIQWTVGNTDLTPISCSNVNILFSSDGGDTYPTTLVSNTPNDGTEFVTMPLNGTVTGRIKIEAVGNIFFTINKTDFSIISDCVTNSSSIINDDSVTANAGDPSLDLGLLVGEEITSVSGNFDSSYPNTNLIGSNNSSGSCSAFTNMPYYKSHILTATATDTYVFTTSGSANEVINIYEDEFSPPITSCQNWIGSNFSFNPVTIGNTYSISLSDGDVIEMVISGFNSNETGSFNVNFSSNSLGSLINTDVLPIGFIYRFAIYNSSGFIIDIVDEANLTDGTIYYDDTYTVKGFMTIASTDLSLYNNQTFSSLQNDITNGTICGELSSNDVSVTINGCTAGNKVVTSGLDISGITTLRHKIENGCQGDTIYFDPSLLNSTLLLTSEIVVTKDIVVVGLGAPNLLISGNNISRIFNINAGTTLSLFELALINSSSATDGGAFLNNGDLYLKNINFAGNKSGLDSKAFTNFGTIKVAGSVNVED